MSYLISHPDVEGDPAVVPERALPAYASKGWVLEGRVVADAAPSVPRIELAKPAKGATAAEWRTYAVVDGMAFEEAMAKTRDVLAEHYHPAPKPDPTTPKAGTPAKTPQES